MSTVFSYEVRGKTIYADPFRVRRRLLEHTDGRAWQYMHDLSGLKDMEDRLRDEEKQVGDSPEDVERVRAQLALTFVNIAKLEGVLVEATMEAFEFAPVDPETGEGLTEAEALDILSQYMEFAEGKG